MYPFVTSFPKPPSWKRINTNNHRFLTHTSVYMSLKEFTHEILPVKDKLFRLAVSLTGSGPEAEDIVQEAFIKLWKMKDDLHQITNLEAWSMRITRNIAIDKLRRRQRQAERPHAELPVHADYSTPHHIAETNDTFLHLRRMMEQLPEKQKTIMQLRDIEGLSYQEIAETLEINLTQVKVYLHRARQTMRELLLKTQTLS